VSRPSRTLPPGKTRYPLYRRLGGPQGQSRQVRKISPPPGFDPRTAQPVGSSYTDCVTRRQLITHIITHKEIKTTKEFGPHLPTIRRVTNLFKNTKTGMAFKATATLQQLIRPTTQNPKSDYEKSGIYKITCKTCHKSYVGQTSGNLKLRFQEHTRYFKNKYPRSSYALHILNRKHE
jgi:hypothetical protein